MYKLNLQLLANANTQTTGTTALSPENKTFYDTDLIRMASPNLVHSQFGVKRPIPKGKGKKIEFRKFGKFAKATTPLTEGVTPDGSNMTVTAIEKEVAQYGDYTTTSDFLELTAIDDFILEVTEAHGKNAGLTLDTITRNELNTGTNVVYAPKADGTVVTSRASLDATALMTPALVAKVAALLKGNDAPKIDGKYVAIIHPYVAHDLMRNEEWIDVHKYEASRNIFNGEIGELYGVRFVETSEAKIWSGEGCPAGLGVFSTIFLGKGAYGDIDITSGGLEVIVKQKGSAGSADPLDQRSTVGWKATYATKIIIPEYLYRVESCSTFSDSATAN